MAYMIYTYISLYNYCCKDVSVTWRSSKNGPSFFVLHNQAKINPFAKSSLKPTQMLNFAQVVETLVTSPTLGGVLREKVHTCPSVSEILANYTPEESLINAVYDENII